MPEASRSSYQCGSSSPGSHSMRQFALAYWARIERDSPGATGHFEGHWPGPRDLSSSLSASFWRSFLRDSDSASFGLYSSLFQSEYTYQTSFACSGQELSRSYLISWVLCLQGCQPKSVFQFHFAVVSRSCLWCCQLWWSCPDPFRASLDLLQRLRHLIDSATDRVYGVCACLNTFICYFRFFN